MSRSHSIFAPSELDTFNVPIDIFDNLLASSDAGANSVLVYLYILRRALSDGPVVRFHTGEALADIGISRPVFYDSRDALIAAKLVRAKETSKQGVWEYEVRDPKGKKLPTYEDHVVFAELTAAELESYYSDRLGVKHAPAQDTGGNPLFVCPFHADTRSKPTLRVTVDGDAHHGRFICGSRRCGKRGGLIDFEVEMARKQRRELTKSQAARAVRAFMVSNRSDEESQNPIVKELMEMPLGNL
jgi:hypothetical protein